MNAAQCNVVGTSPGLLNGTLKIGVGGARIVFHMQKFPSYFIFRSSLGQIPAQEPAVLLQRNNFNIKVIHKIRNRIKLHFIQTAKDKIKTIKPLLRKHKAHSKIQNIMVYFINYY